MQIKVLYKNTRAILEPIYPANASMNCINTDLHVYEVCWSYAM
jgi:hypothetical protein